MLIQWKAEPQICKLKNVKVMKSQGSQKKNPVLFKEGSLFY